MSDNSRVKVPVILQMEATECGAASLAMILAYFGRWIPPEQMRRDCGISRDGSKASYLLKAARLHGCDAHGYKWDAATLRSDKVSFPLIIHWEFNHFVVLEGIKGDTVYLNDPAVGRYTVSWDSFRTSYTGIALQIKPGPDFSKEGQSYSMVKAVFKKVQKDKWAVAFIVLLSLAMVVPQLSLPVFTQVFLDDIMTGRHPDWMFNLCLAMVLSALLYGVMNLLRSWVLTKWQAKLTVLDSATFFWHVVKLPMEFFSQRYSGEIAARIGFAQSIAGVLSGSVATVVLDLITVVFFLILLLQYSVILTIIGIGFSAVNLVIFFYLRRRLTEMSMRIHNDEGRAYSVAINGLKMIESIKANGSEADLFTKVAGYQAKIMTEEQKMAILSQRIKILPPVLSGLNTALIMTIGGCSVMEGVMTAGAFIAFQNLMVSFQTPFNNILSVGRSLNGTEMQMKRMDDVELYGIDKLNFPDAEAEYQGSMKLSGRLELKNVYFGYNTLEEALLRGINLTIKPGHWVAVVGESGSGKSTLGKIITGLYQEWSGKILFDGKSRRDIPRRVMINSLSSVDQEIFHISGTVLENISLFDRSIPREDVVQAAKDACIHDDILQINGGYDTKVMEAGVNFSGGQRQRLEIARALAVNPSLLVLDEATSALDPLTEMQIIENIRRRGCACLVVAHRLSTIRDCDEIIVLEHGRIVERGTHKELVEMSGLYCRLMNEGTADAEDGSQLGGGSW